MKFFPQRQSVEHRIERLFKEASCLTDEELKGEMAKYICILAAGFIEIRCREIFSGYAARRMNPSLMPFIDNQLTQFRNLKIKRLLDLVGLFDNDKREAIETEIKGDESYAAAVTSIVGNRNNLAHGQDASGISLGQVGDYFLRAKRFINTLETKFS